MLNFLSKVIVNTFNKIVLFTALKTRLLTLPCYVELKEGSTVLAMPLTQMCNLSITLSVFPNKCKHAKLKPLFKQVLADE